MLGILFISALLEPQDSVAKPGILFGGGGFNKFSWGQSQGFWRQL